MNAAAWIAIAAIIATLMTSWSQFWLKERNEKKRALATANPATNQPSALTKRAPNSLRAKQHWRLIAFTDWLSNTLFLYMLISLLSGTLAFSLTSCLAVICSFALAVTIKAVLFDEK